MQQEQREEIARFRFGVISDLVGGLRLEPGDAAELIRRKSLQRYNIPFSHRTRISEPTIRRWVRLYEREGQRLEALSPSQRADRGKSRRVDDETVAALIRLKTAKPAMPVVELLREMTQKSLVSPGTILCPSTAYRILKAQGLTRGQAAKVDRRRFEAEFPNDIWQSDVMHGPQVTVAGKMRKAYLIAVLDDHSRLLPHAGFYLSERLESWLDAFRQALLRRGLPRRLYVDNGAAYRTKHLEHICASLGIALTHTPPYTPQGRGKIERFFRTVRSRFLPGFEGHSLDELNLALDRWVQDEYHQRRHSGTGETPFARFARHLEIIRTAPPDLEDHFRKQARRRVAKDRTVSLDGRVYEAPTRLIGEYIQLLYHEDRTDQIEIRYKNASQGFLVPLQAHVNCHVRRRKGQDCLVPQQDTNNVSGKLNFSPEGN
jgi:transposase InsO family protein